MKYTIEMDETDLQLYLEGRKNIGRDLYKRSHTSYIGNDVKSDGVTYKHSFNNKYGCDVMSEELLKVIGHPIERTYKPIPEDPNFKLGDQYDPRKM